MKKNNLQIWRFIYKSHRFIGIFSTLIFLMLAVTGIALNHTEDLQLDSNMIQSPHILDWYNIEKTNDIKSFSTTNHWISQSNQQIYFNQNNFLHNEESLLGAVETGEYIVIAFRNALWLLTLQGELIEKIAVETVEQIGTNNQQHIVILSSKSVLLSDDDLLSWQATDNNQKLRWSQSTVAPKPILQVINQNSRLSILPLERVILDIHSGRFFGYFGVIIVDISGVFLILLSLSGCAIWLKRQF